MFIFKCTKCKKELAAHEDAQYCPYCNTKTLTLQLNKTVDSINYIPKNPLMYWLPLSSFATEHEILQALMLLLQPNTFINNHVNKIEYGDNIDYSVVLNMFERLVKLYMKKKSIVYKTLGEINNFKISKNDVYMELRYVTKNKQICFGQSLTGSVNVNDITHHYLSNGWEYYYVRGNKFLNFMRLIPWVSQDKSSRTNSKTKNIS